MSTTECTTQQTLFEVGSQAVVIDFDAGRLSRMRGCWRSEGSNWSWGGLAGVAALMPDPRAQAVVREFLKADTPLQALRSDATPGAVTTTPNLEVAHILQTG